MEVLYGLLFYILEVFNFKLRKFGWVKLLLVMVVFVFVLFFYFLVIGGKGFNNFYLIVFVNSFIICIFWLVFDCINVNFIDKFWFFVMFSLKYLYLKFCFFDYLIYYFRGYIELKLIVVSKIKEVCINVIFSVVFIGYMVRN